MNEKELEKLAHLTADIVQDRMCAMGAMNAAVSKVERQEQLRTDLIALSEKYSVENEVIANVRAVIAEHGFVMVDDSNGSGSKSEARRLTPPDFKPEGPSDEDIQKEIDKLCEKFHKLCDPQRYGYEYEHKYPWNREIDVNMLVNILIELFKLIRKLLKRLDLLHKHVHGGGSSAKQPDG